VAIGIYDVIGKEIIPLTGTTELNAGSYSFPITKNTLKQGIYFVKLKIGNSSVVRKIIVE
jgi:hypothetical protein